MSETDEQKEARKKASMFPIMLTVFLSLTILTAGVLWEVYGDLPAQYYVPVSVVVVIVYGVLAYVFLSRTINIS